jgi:peptide deformylase
MDVETSKLTIVHYPHPVLRKRCEPVTVFDEQLAEVVARMQELMGEARGVGLAAPQVNLAVRLFVMNATGEPEDMRVYVNPSIRDAHGSVEAEEGCLSLPGVHVSVRRAQRCRIVAQDLKGNPIEEEATDLVARIWQHETDHLNGTLILDRMGPSDRMATRRTLRALEAAYAELG